MRTETRVELAPIYVDELKAGDVGQKRDVWNKNLVRYANY